MKNIEFYGDLKEDIINAQKPDKIEKKAFNSGIGKALSKTMLAYLLAILFLPPFSLGQALFLGICFSVLYSVEEVKKLNKEIKVSPQKEKSLKKLSKLCYNLQKENVMVEEEQLFKMEAFSFPVLKKEVQQNKTNSDLLQINIYFYEQVFYGFLDKEENLQVLKELKENIENEDSLGLLNEGEKQEKFGEMQEKIKELLIQKKR